MAKYEVRITADFSGTVHVEADSEDEAIDIVDSAKSEYLQDSLDSGDFPDKQDIEVEYANKIKEDK